MNSAAPDLKAVFAQATEIASPAERAAYLDEACGEDAGLRAQIDGLLAAAEKAGSFMRGPAVAHSDTERFAPVTERPGTVIGPYKLLQQIGEGGMGVVFMAEQSEPIQRTVALKIIKPGMDTRQVIARFEAERQAVAMMDHPNVARVLDVGTTDAGLPYFVMDLVKGVPITDYCDQQHLPVRERLELVSAVCHAVQHAHQKGIIHRDIKPSNVLVAEYDGQPVPKIIDFGVAKATAQKLTERTMFTELGQVVGTVEYMSPEQSRFNQLDIDTRSDVYSLGVLLYELLTGSTPFGRKRLNEAAFDEMLRIIREEEPPKPSTRLSSLSLAERGTSLASIAANRGSEPLKLNRLVQGELDWIVMKCLEKDRNRRYETASAFAADIQRYLDDETVHACPPSPVYRFRKFARRNRTLLVAGGAIATALVVGLGLSTVLFFRERAAVRIAKTNETRAEVEAAKSQTVARFMTEMLKGVGPSVALGRDTTMLREILDQTAERLNELKDQPAVEAYLRTTLGNVYRDLGEYKRAEAMHRAALAQRISLFGDEHPDVAASLHGLAEDLRNQYRFAEAEPVFQQSLAMRRKLLGEEHLDVAQSLFHLGLLFDLQNNGSRAEPFFRQALALQRKLLNKDHPSIAETLDQLGLALTFQGKYEEAEAAHHEALAIRRKVYDDEHPEIVTSRAHFAILLACQGKYHEAEELFREILAINRKRLGDAHPALIHTLHFFAFVQAEQGKFAEAEAILREALAMRLKLGYSDSRPIKRLFDLGRLCEAQDRLPEAEEFYREVIAKDSKELRDRGDGFQGFCLAMAHSKLGHKDEAHKWYQQAVEWMETNNPNNEQLRRFRAEAAELLGITEPKPGSAPVQPADHPAKADTPTTTSQPTTDN